VPRISQFHGIVIYMYHTEHAPAHFHAIFGEREATIGIDPIAVVGGDLPARIRRLVFEWTAIHQAELATNWLRARRLEPLHRIEPLP
jgi:hypothetical protein